MVNFTTNQLRQSMDNPNNIRNVTIAAHVDAGKTTTTDALLHKCGIISGRDAGTKCGTDTRQDEQERGITIKSTGISLHCSHQMKGESEKKSYLINLVDSPGHVDFSSEVTAALRITDGAIILIEAVSGVQVQTETVVKQAIADKIKPVLMINKLDRLFLELKMDKVEMFSKLRRHIENVNVLLSSCQDSDLGDIQVDPLKDTILFGSGYQQWGFTLGTFAKIYAPKFGKTDEEMKSRMWDYYFIPPEKDASGKVIKTAKWSKSNKTGTGIPGFVHLVLTPINKLINMILNQNKEKLTKMLDSINVKVSKDDWAVFNSKPRSFIKIVMNKWLPLSNALTTMIIEKLPSPAEAQKYRSRHLYTGPDDESLRGMQNCDPNGPVVMFVSKMLPPNENDKRFVAFGRLFSGTIRSNQKYKIMGANYEFGGSNDLSFAKAAQTVTLMGGKVDRMDDIPAGNTCALTGLDDYIVKSGTIASLEEAHPIKNMKFSVSPVVQKSVTTKKASDLGKLSEGLKKLKSMDSAVEVKHLPSGEYIVAGPGNLHLEICLEDLKRYVKGAELVIGEPVVQYKETIIAAPDTKFLTKSPNKHNRLWVKVSPLTREFCEDYKNGVISDKPLNENDQSKYIADTYGLNRDHISKNRRWAMGPTDNNVNLLVDATVSTQYMNEIREACKSGFTWATNDGPLIGSPIERMKIDIVDVTMHADAIHRGQGQIMPPMRRVIHGAMLSAQPRLLEPIFLVSVTVPQDFSGGVFNVITKKRGIIQNNEQVIGSNMVTITAHLPVAEATDFDAEIRGATSGKAFASCSYSHHEILDSDPYEEGSQANEIVKKERARRNMPELKTPDHFLDKL